MRLIDADELEKCILKWLPREASDVEDCGIAFNENMVVSMMMEIEEQPTIDAIPVCHGGWISVDKELPPEGKEVLCLCDCGYEGVQFYGIGWCNSNSFWYAIAPFSQNPKVLAWMPLPPKPEPPEGSKHDTRRISSTAINGKIF